MKDLCQYGNRPEDEWEILPWIPDPRPPFKIWVKPEQIAPFFLIPHHPYAISLLLKDQRRIPDRGILPAGTDRQQRGLGAACPGRDPGVRGKQQRRGSVSLRLRRRCVLRVLPIHRRFDDAGQNDPGGL